jgi:hypothetical protein
MKSHKKITKQYIEIKVFFIFLLVDGRIQIRSGAGSVQKAQKHMDPTDPNPDAEH